MKQLASFLLLLLSISAFSQGPWTQEKGKFYTQFSFSTIPSYNELFGDTDYKINGEISDNTFQLYGEYGISDKTTLLLNVPLKSISINHNINCASTPCETIDYKETALGNIEIGIKHNFYKKDWLLSGQFSVEANTGSFNTDSGIRTGYNAWSFTPLFLVGKKFKNSYLQTFIGGNIRTNNYSSNFKFGGEYGGKISKNIWLVGFIDISKSFKNGDFLLNKLDYDYTTFPYITGLYVNNQEYGVVGVKAIGEFSDNFGMTASLPAAFFGNNVAKQVALSVGVYKKF